MKQFVTILMMVLSSISYAEGLESEKQVRVFSDQLMDKFVAKQFTQGLNSAKPYWPLPEIEIDALSNQINQQWPIVDQRFGQAIDKEFVKEERIGESFLRYYYLHKFEKHAIYWQLDFYKPKNEWMINSIIFLDSLETLYE